MPALSCKSIEGADGDTGPGAATLAVFLATASFAGRRIPKPSIPMRNAGERQRARRLQGHCLEGSGVAGERGSREAGGRWESGGRSAAEACRAWVVEAKNRNRKF